ncbi:MAG: tRNA (adenosine(37)-N6)-threonylcarbamoyltransferase complex dimerization subunit type 1 TsaB [Candidatus Omnitrophica bacterium]|nr:tRNA (adenosine(37)-N6)-threonylcarbamoyltransferase complex dimerization subunit type 1 TsaB [Candidatus Omnitrophota bacterium]
MKILCVDTASPRLCIGVAAGGGREYEYSLDVGTRLSGALVPTIKRVVDACGLKLDAFDYFAVCRGPGSFTGTRVGMAAMKAFSWSLDIPLAGIASLDILAGNAEGKAAFCVPVVDARRDLLYAAVYALRGGTRKRLSAYLLVNADDLAGAVRTRLPASALPETAFLGDGLNVCAGRLREKFRQAQFLDKDYWKPGVRCMLAEVREAVRRKAVGDADSVQPLYLYPKECQIRPKP